MIRPPSSVANDRQSDTRRKGPTHARIRKPADEPLPILQQIFYIGSSDEDSDETRARKRLKRDQFAADYLKHGYVPILTASLKGPFSNSWTNPWAKRKSKTPGVEETPGARRKSGHASARRSSPGARRTVEEISGSKKAVRSVSGLGSPFRMSSEIGPPTRSSRERPSNLGHAWAKEQSHLYEAELGQFLDSGKSLLPHKKIQTGDRGQFAQLVNPELTSPSLRKSIIKVRQNKDQGANHQHNGRKFGIGGQVNQISSELSSRNGTAHTGKLSHHAQSLANHRINLRKRAKFGRHTDKFSDKDLRVVDQSLQKSNLLQACSEYLQANASDGSDSDEWLSDDADDDVSELEAGILPTWPDASDESYEARMWWKYVRADLRDHRQIFFNQLPVINNDGLVEAFDDENLHDIDVLLRDASNRLQALLDRTSGDATTKMTIKRIDVLLQLNQSLEKVQNVIEIRERLRNVVISLKKFIEYGAKLLLAQAGAADSTWPGLNMSLGEFMKQAFVIETDDGDQEWISQSSAIQDVQEAPADDGSNDGDIEMNDEEDSEQEDAEVLLENNAEHAFAQIIQTKHVHEDVEMASTSFNGAAPENGALYCGKDTRSRYPLKQPEERRSGCIRARSCSYESIDIDQSKAELENEVSADAKTTKLRTRSPPEPSSLPDQSRSGKIEVDHRSRSLSNENSTRGNESGSESMLDNHDGSRLAEKAGPHIQDPDGPIMCNSPSPIDRTVISDMSTDRERPQSDHVSAQQQVNDQIIRLIEERSSKSVNAATGKAVDGKITATEVILIESDSDIDIPIEFPPGIENQISSEMNGVVSLQRGNQDQPAGEMAASSKDPNLKPSSQPVRHGHVSKSSVTLTSQRIGDVDNRNENNVHLSPISKTSRDTGPLKIISQTETWSESHPVRATLAKIDDDTMAGTHAKQLSDEDVAEAQGERAERFSQSVLGSSPVEGLATEPPLWSWPSMSGEDQEKKAAQTKTSHQLPTAQDNGSIRQLIHGESGKAVSLLSTTPRSLNQSAHANPVTISKGEHQSLLFTSDPRHPPASQPVTPTTSLSRLPKSLLPAWNSSPLRETHRHAHSHITDEEERLALEDAQEFLSTWTSEKKSLLGRS